MANLYLGAVAVLLLMEACYLRPNFAPYAALSLYLLPLTTFAGQSSALSTGSRVIAVFCALSALMRVGHITGLAGLDIPRPLKAYTILALLSLTWAEKLPRSINAVAALVCGLGLVLALGTSNFRRSLWHSLAGWALAVVGVNLVAIVANGLALGERSSGILANPNGLGVFSVLALPLLVRRYGALSVPTFMAFATLLLSGSRGAFAAFAVMGLMAMLAFAGKLRASLTVTMVPLAAFLMWRAFQYAQSNSGTSYGLAATRSDDSRGATWALALRTIRKRPLLGHGYGYDYFVDPASSVLKALLEGGVVFLAAIAVAVLVAIRVMLRRPSNITSLILVPAALTSALFESWLLAGGSVYFVLFWTMMMLLDRESSPRLTAFADAVAPTAVRVGPRRRFVRR